MDRPSSSSQDNNRNSGIRELKHRQDRVEFIVEDYKKVDEQLEKLSKNIKKSGVLPQKLEKLERERNKLKEDIKLAQEKALEGKNTWKIWRSYKTLSSDYHNKRQEGENELSRIHHSLKEMHNRAQKLHEDAKQMFTYGRRIDFPKKSLEVLKENVDELIKYYKQAKFEKTSSIHACFKELQDPKGEYKRLLQVVTEAQKSLEASFKDMKEGRMEISFDRLERQLDECSSAVNALKGRVYNTYLGRVERAIEAHKYIEDLFTKLPDYYRDGYQKKFDELRERVLNPDEKYPSKAERDYVQYLEHFTEMVAADKPRRLSDLDKRAKDLIGRLPDRYRDGYQRQFDELSRKASSDSFRLDPLIAEKRYRQLIEKTEKEILYGERTKRISELNKQDKYLLKDLKMLKSREEYYKIFKSIQLKNESALKHPEDVMLYESAIKDLSKTAIEGLNEIKDDNSKIEQFIYKNRMYDNWEKKETGTKLSLSDLDTYNWMAPSERRDFLQPLMEYQKIRQSETEEIYQDLIGSYNGSRGTRSFLEKCSKGIDSNNVNKDTVERLRTKITGYQENLNNYYDYIRSDVTNYKLNPEYWGLENHEKFERNFSEFIQNYNNLSEKLKNFANLYKNVKNLKKYIEESQNTHNQSGIAKNAQELITLIDAFHKSHEDYRTTCDQLNEELKASPLLPRD